MKINNIQLYNFKSYYGKTSMDFETGLNLVSGKIGTGKTSLFEAFQWILLEDIYKNYSIDENFVLNQKAKEEGLHQEITETQALVIIEVDDKEITYKITKAATYTLQNGQYTLKNIDSAVEYTDSRTGNTKIITDKREVKSQLDELFPERLRRYLLFKGEHISSLIDFSNPSTLEQAVKQISYLPLFNRMERIIEVIEENTSNRYRNKLKTLTRDENRFKNLSLELDEKSQEIKEIKSKLKTIKEKIETLEGKEKEYVEKLKFIAGFPELKEEEIKLKNESASILREMERLDSNGKNAFINKWILSPGKELLEKSAEELQKFKTWRHEKISENQKQLEIGVPGDHLINQMLQQKRCLICETSAPENSKEYKNIEKHLDKNKNFRNLLSPEIEDLNEKVIDISKNIVPIKSLLASTKEDIANHFKQDQLLKEERNRNLEKLNEVKEKIKSLVEQKGYGILDLNPKTITDAFYSVQKEIKSQRSHKGFYEKKETTLVDEIRELNKKLEKTTKSSINLEKLPEKLALNHIQNVRKLIEKKVETEKIDLIKKIENEANNIQENILKDSEDNELIVVYVSIDKEDYTLTFTDKEGNPNPSHGAQDTLAQMSIISAVLKLSNEYKGESYPFVVDAPTSNFDETITKPFIKSVSKNFSQGVVILKGIHSELENYKKEDFTRTIHLIEKKVDSPNGPLTTNSYTTHNKIK